MSREPIWLLKSVVLALHDEQIAEHGGLEGLRDEGYFLDSRSPVRAMPSPMAIRACSKWRRRCCSN